jgi:hypothetical protein
MKKRIIACLVCLGLALLLVLFLNVSISGAPHMAGGAICISFDKWDMLRADKIIISCHGKTYTVTDPAFIRAFTQETLAGTYSDYCCANLNDGWVEIYRGDRLLRRMRYIANHDAFAYEADAAHWVLFGEEGHAFLTKETWEQLHEFFR